MGQVLVQCPLLSPPAQCYCMAPATTPSNGGQGRRGSVLLAGRAADMQGEQAPITTTTITSITIVTTTTTVTTIATVFIGPSHILLSEGGGKEQPLVPVQPLHQP